MRALARFLLVVVALVGAAAAANARGALGPLLTPAELEPLVRSGRVAVLDVRAPKPGETPGPHEAGHIPGAVAAPYPSWRGPADNPGKLPDVGALESLVRQAGIDGTKPVVVVHAGTDATDFGTAARVYWTLAYLGVPELAILNGGMAAWREAGLPMDHVPGRLEWPWLSTKRWLTGTFG